MRFIAGLLCIFLSIWINSMVKPNLRTWSISPLPKPEAARLLSGEFTVLSSDYFLMKAAIFYGGIENLSKKDSLWLTKTLYLASYLDPYYFEPYWMAGVTLPWEGEIESAKMILKQGLHYLPKRWEVPFYLGFISFYFEKKPAEAARYFLMASKLPNAPFYLPLLAARLAVKGNETSVAIAFLQTELKQTKDNRMCKLLQKRLKALEAIDFLERAVRKYKQRYGHFPPDLNALIKENIISAIPPDPYGGHFYMTEKGKVWTTSNLR